MRVDEMVVGLKKKYNSLLSEIHAEENYLGQQLIGGGSKEDTTTPKLFVVINHDCHLAFTGNGSYYIKPKAVFTSRQEAEEYAAEESKKEKSSLLWEVFEVGA